MSQKPRIASLLPSATEIVCAVGARDQLVGVSHECDWPPDVRGLPVLTRTRRELPRRSGAIHRDVVAIVRDALAVYEVIVERLRRLEPDVIVTQDLCDVCAVSSDDVLRALRELAREDIAIVSLRPERLHDVWDDVRRVGAALGRSAEADGIARVLEQRCEAIAARFAGCATRPSVLTIEWLDPVMVGGTWMPELVALAGGEALVTRPGEHAPTVDSAALEALDPDVVLIKPCGFDLQRTAEELDLLACNLPWRDWRAVPEGRVFVADGSAYFNRPGPRLVESLEILAACMHPKSCADLAARHGDAFRRVTPDLVMVPIDMVGD